MPRKTTILTLLFLLFMTPVFAKTSIDDEVSMMFDLSGNRTEQIGITIRHHGITQPEFIARGPYIPVREIFPSSTINWDHEAKVATVENDGKQLVITCNENFMASDDQIVWPSEWAVLQDGRMTVLFPYLAFIFDRHADHKDNSEAASWKEKLSFLGISYIDNNDSSAKDQTLHSFINFE